MKKILFKANDNISVCEYTEKSCANLYFIYWNNRLEMSLYGVKQAVYFARQAARIKVKNKSDLWRFYLYGHRKKLNERNK